MKQFFVSCESALRRVEASRARSACKAGRHLDRMPGMARRGLELLALHRFQGATKEQNSANKLSLVIPSAGGDTPCHWQARPGRESALPRFFGRVPFCSRIGGCCVCSRPPPAAGARGLPRKSGEKLLKQDYFRGAKHGVRKSPSISSIAPSGAANRARVHVLQHFWCRRKRCRNMPRRPDTGFNLLA